MKYHLSYYYCLLYLECWLYIFQLGQALEREVEGSFEFSILMLSISIYIIGYAFELSRSNFDGMMDALRVEYIGLPFISISFLLFYLEVFYKEKIK